MTGRETESRELLDGHSVALGRGSQLSVRLEDGRESRTIPLLAAFLKRLGLEVAIVVKAA
jgi:hypothetical protein